MALDRMKILQLLSDGGIDAETASKLLSGELNTDTIKEVKVESEPVVEAVKEPEPEPSPSVDELKATSKVTLIAIEDEGDSAETKSTPDKNVRVVVTGKPLKIDLDLSVPSGLVGAAKQLGAFLLKEESDAAWEEVSFSFNEGKQHVRIFTEQTA